MKKIADHALAGIMFGRGKLACGFLEYRQANDLGLPLLLDRPLVNGLQHRRADGKEGKQHDRGNASHRSDNIMDEHPSARQSLQNLDRV